MKKSKKNIKGGIGHSTNADCPPFITFIAVILTRLAYLSDCGFLLRYYEIFGTNGWMNINQNNTIESNFCKQFISRQNFEESYIDKIKPISDDILNNINTLNILNIFDNTTFNTIPECNNFIPLAKYVNYVNGESSLIDVDVFRELTPMEYNNNIDVVKTISITLSYYGSVYITADKRMNSIWVIFRGTSSAESVFNYIRINSVRPTPMGGSNFQTIEGIYSRLIDKIHLIIESVRYLSDTFLETPNQKLFTTGHSLGGAQCTIFSLLWAEMLVYSCINGEYIDYNFPNISKNIVCISVASPKVFNLEAVQRFKMYMTNNIILFRRVVTELDPVPYLPPNSTYYYHPDYDYVDATQILCNYANKRESYTAHIVPSIRTAVASAVILHSKKNGLREDKSLTSLQSQVSHPYINYRKGLDCDCIKTRIDASYPGSSTVRGDRHDTSRLFSAIWDSFTEILKTNPLAHASYLYISYIQTGFTFQVFPGIIDRKRKSVFFEDTCRIIISSIANRKEIFLTTQNMHNGSSDQDNLITKENFNELIENSIDCITNQDTRVPTNNIYYEFENKETLAPPILCTLTDTDIQSFIGSECIATGGKRTNKRSNKRFNRKTRKYRYK